MTAAVPGRTDRRRIFGKLFAVEPEFVKARQLLQAGRLADAESLCRRALATDPSDAQVLTVLGMVQRQLGCFDEAERLFHRCVDLAPSNPEFRTNFAQLLGAREQLDRSVAEFERAIALEPHFRPARLGLARVANRAQRYVMAEAQARSLVASDERDSEAWDLLGAALLGMSKGSEARAAFERSISLAPDRGATHYSLAAALCEEERSEEALAHAESAARLGVSHRGVELTRARALMQLDRYDDAERVLVPLVTVTPRDIEAQSLLAQLRHVRGDADFASEFREAASKTNAPVALCAAYADTIRLSGNLELSEILLRHSLSKAGPVPELLIVYGAILHDSGRYAEAVEVTGTAAAAQPDSVSAAEHYVAALLSAGDARAALPTIERFRERHPDDQRWITYRADVARQRTEALFDEWCDLERLVRVYELAPPAGYATIEEFHEVLRPALELRHRHTSHPLDQSLRHGTRSSRGLLAESDRIIRAYLEALALPIAAYQAEVGYAAAHPMLMRNTAPARLVRCWSVRLRRGGFHVNHIHPQGWMSSAYYVSVPAEVEDAAARSGWIKFGEPRFPMPGANAGRFVQPKVGRLVLFPSYLWHGTTALHGHEPRVTIAFDAVPGTAG